MAATLLETTAFGLPAAGLAVGNAGTLLSKFARSRRVFASFALATDSASTSLETGVAWSAGAVRLLTAAVGFVIATAVGSFGAGLAASGFPTGACLNTSASLRSCRCSVAFSDCVTSPVGVLLTVVIFAIIALGALFALATPAADTLAAGTLAAGALASGFALATTLEDATFAATTLALATASESFTTGFAGIVAGSVFSTSFDVSVELLLFVERPAVCG